MTLDIEPNAHLRDSFQKKRQSLLKVAVYTKKSVSVANTQRD